MRQYTAQDAEAFTNAEEQLSKNGLDRWTQEGVQRNADLLDQFFQSNPTLPVNLQNIYRAVETRKTEFAWLSAAAANWYRAVQGNQELGNQIASYLASTSGRPGAMAKDGDQLFENLFLLFNELQSRRESVTPQTIANAENRIANRVGKQLHRVPTPRKAMGTITEAARKDDGTPFLGDLIPDGRGGFRTRTFHEQRANREEAEAEAAKSNQTTSLTASDQTWRNMALEACSDGRTHSEKAQIRAVYDQHVGVSAPWREVYDAVNQTRNTLKRRREMLPA